jgi:hypothetical protein
MSPLCCKFSREITRSKAIRDSVTHTLPADGVNLYFRFTSSLPFHDGYLAQSHGNSCRYNLFHVS